MDAVTFYLKELNRKSAGYRPTWLPGLPIRVGDVGILENEVFRQETTLSNLGIAFEMQTSENSSTIDLSSESGITITTKVKGKVEPKAVSLGIADAGFIVEFNAQNSFVFKIRGSRISTIRNLGDIKAEVLRRYYADNWDINLVIASEVVEARSATILLSGHSGCKVELGVEADIHVANLDLADSALNLRFESGQTLAAKIIGEKGITPLYRAVGVRERLFSTSFGGRNPEAKAQKPQAEFEVVEIEMGNLSE